MRAVKKSRNAEATRTRILDVSLAEFAAEGLDGARVDHIARAAGVNKALLYYYFRDKETLYGGVLDHVFEQLFGSLRKALRSSAEPREQLMAYARAHFKFILEHRQYPAIIQREMMRAGRNPSPHLDRVFSRFGLPFYQEMAQVMRNGMRRGEFRRMDAEQAIISIVGVVVFYFISSARQKVLAGYDPFSPAIIARRKREMLSFIAAAVSAERPKSASKRARKKQ